MVLNDEDVPILEASGGLIDEGALDEGFPDGDVLIFEASGRILDDGPLMKVFLMEMFQYLKHLADTLMKVHLLIIQLQ